MVAKADILYRWYNEVWIAGHHDRIEQIYQPEIADKCLLPGETADIDDVRELVTVLGDRITDQTVRIVKTIETGDWVAALVEMHGKCTDTHKPVFMRWMTMVRIKDDLIVESYPCINFLRFFEQLGQLPNDSFELLLGRTVLR